MEEKFNPGNVSSGPTTLGAGMGKPMAGLFAEAVAMAQASSKPKADVITIARACRDGKIYVQIIPASNGYTVQLQNVNGGMLVLVFNRPQGIGHLMKALYAGNLENEEVLSRLRKLLNF